MKIIDVLFLAILLVISGCSKPDFSKDEVGNSIYLTEYFDFYTNEYFDFTVKVPVNWYVESEERFEELIDVVIVEILDDENKRKEMVESVEQLVPLFTFSKHKRGSPKIRFTSESVSNFSKQIDGLKYNLNTKNNLHDLDLNLMFPSEVFSVNISGVMFDVMPTQITVNEHTVYQEYYAARINDYILVFISTYTSDLEKNDLQKIIDSIVFHEK